MKDLIKKSSRLECDYWCCDHFFDIVWPDYNAG